MNSGILLGEFTHVSSLRIPQSCRMNFSHNGSWHSAFAIRHFMIHRRMLFLRWQFSGTDSILNLGASGLQLTCTTLQLYQSTNTYYSCTIACWRRVSTTAVLNLVPPPGYYYYPVISFTSSTSAEQSQLGRDWRVPIMMSLSCSIVKMNRVWTEYISTNRLTSIIWIIDTCYILGSLKKSHTASMMV